MFRVAVLVKQVPRFDELSLGPDGRLKREGIELELNPFCRRAVSKGVELARQFDGRATVITLGPPQAEDCLREAIAWGADEGVHVTDAAFAGSDSLATARALAAILTREGPFDLVLVGRNSVDSDTGQVGPELAELLELPFLSAVRELELADRVVQAECERDDGWLRASVSLPAVLSCAERLCEPAKVDPPDRALVSGDKIRRIAASDLGPGPWGVAASPTVVGEVRSLSVERHREILTGSLEERVHQLVRIMTDSGALVSHSLGEQRTVPPKGEMGGRPLAVLIEPGRPLLARELLGAAAHLAELSKCTVVALIIGSLEESGAPFDEALVGSWGADEILLVDGVTVEEDVARAVGEWSREHSPWAILAPSTMWGREIASRVAGRLGAGLIGDAVDLEVVDGRLLGWKPAFGGGVVAAITATSAVQMVTVRPGVLPLPVERSAHQPRVTRRTGQPLSTVRHLAQGRDDEVEDLATAEAIIGVGAGVSPDDYPAIRPLLDALDAELGATRKVTDKHWLPRARQIGITGRAVSPGLYVAIGVSGKFNHMVGVRAAGLVVAINSDADAPVFDFADVGIVADWKEVVPMVVEALSAVRATVR